MTQRMDVATLEREVDEILVDALPRFADHRFFAQLYSLRLPQPAAARWAAQFYQVVRLFPRWYAGVYARCPDEEAREWLGRNLIEEHGGSHPMEESHPALFRRFGASLDLTSDEMENAIPVPGTQAFLDCMTILVNGPWLEGMAALGLGIEALVARLPTFAGGASVFAEAFRASYGLTAHDVEFFTLHTSADLEHSRAVFRLLGSRLDAAGTGDMAVNVVRRVTGAWGLLVASADDLLADGQVRSNDEDADADQAGV